MATRNKPTPPVESDITENESAALVEPEQEPIAYRFVPRYHGEFMRGIPPRDLTQSEWDAVREEVRYQASYAREDWPALYQPINPPPPESGESGADQE